MTIGAYKKPLNLPHNCTDVPQSVDVACVRKSVVEDFSSKHVEVVFRCCRAVASSGWCHKASGRAPAINIDELPLAASLSAGLQRWWHRDA